MTLFGMQLKTRKFYILRMHTYVNIMCMWSTSSGRMFIEMLLDLGLTWGSCSNIEQAGLIWALTWTWPEVPWLLLFKYRTSGSDQALLSIPITCISSENQWVREAFFWPIAVRDIVAIHRGEWGGNQGQRSYTSLHLTIQIASLLCTADILYVHSNDIILKSYSSVFSGLAVTVSRV